MAFGEDFRAMVMPVLRQRTRFYGVLLSLGLREWGDAYASVMHEASQRGAGRLDSKLFAQLRDWIDSALTREMAIADRQHETMKAAEDAEIARDPVAYFHGLAAGTVYPEATQWALASRHPEYRAWLIAERRFYRAGGSAGVGR